MVGSWRHALLVIATLAAGLAGPASPVAASTTTNRGDLARSAWYPGEPALSPDQVAYGFTVDAGQALPVTIAPGQQATFTVTWRAPSGSSGVQPLSLTGSTTLRLNLLGRLR